MLDDGGGDKEGEVSRSGNIVVDSLVNHKYALALKDGIRFGASVLVPSVLPLSWETCWKMHWKAAASCHQDRGTLSWSVHT